MTPGWSATARTAGEHPGHERHPVEGVVPDGEHLAGVAEQHLLVRHEPAQPHRVHRDAVHARPAGAVGVVGGRVRARRRGRRPRARRRSGRRCGRRCRTGRRPCRGGAARRPRPTRRTGRPCAANAIISTAPMAKLGAMSTPTSGCPAAWSRRVASRSSDQPVVPTTTCTPCSTQWATLAGEASGTENSTTTSAPPRSPRSSPTSKRPTSSRSSALLDGAAHGRAHPATGADDGHRRRAHAGTVAMAGGQARVRPPGWSQPLHGATDTPSVHLLFIFRAVAGVPLVNSR